MYPTTSGAPTYASLGRTSRPLWNTPCNVVDFAVTTSTTIAEITTALVFKCTSSALVHRSDQRKYYGCHIVVMTVAVICYDLLSEFPFL